jgi:hypothetical protein
LSDERSQAREELRDWARAREHWDRAIEYLKLARDASNPDVQNRYVTIAQHYRALTARTKKAPSGDLERSPDARAAQVRLSAADSCFRIPQRVGPMTCATARFFFDSEPIAKGSALNLNKVQARGAKDVAVPPLERTRVEGFDQLHKMDR